ncbi:hypothetical protein RB195_023681 [Necator americanus]|uniref:Reverse transcriptase domain-containing protein n=1 Tax=Necator americanus TaxID=51031 RepID=A0ABR1EK62_NECAM
MVRFQKRNGEVQHQLLCVMNRVLERILLDRLIKHREETTRDEQAGFRSLRSTIDQVLIVRRVVEVWQQDSKPPHLASLDFESVSVLFTGAIFSTRFVSVKF